MVGHDPLYDDDTKGRGTKFYGLFYSGCLEVSHEFFPEEEINSKKKKKGKSNRRRTLRWPHKNEALFVNRWIEELRLRGKGLLSVKAEYNGNTYCYYFPNKESAYYEKVILYVDDNDRDINTNIRTPGTIGQYYEYNLTATWGQARGNITKFCRNHPEYEVAAVFCGEITLSPKEAKREGVSVVGHTWALIFKVDKFGKMHIVAKDDGSVKGDPRTSDHLEQFLRLFPPHTLTRVGTIPREGGQDDDFCFRNAFLIASQILGGRKVIDIEYF